MSDCASIRERFFTQGALERGGEELEAHLESCPACRLAARGLPVVDRALAELPRVPVQVPPFAAIAREAAGAARLRRRHRAVRRSLPFFYTGLAAAAAAAIVVVVLASRAGPGGPPVLAVGAQLESSTGSRLAALDSGARIRLEAGAVKVVPASAGEERLFLEAGLVSLEVPKLGAGRALSVCTPDAEVRVHGTRFQVVRNGKGTSVAVSEGLVEVRPTGGGRAALFLRPGESTVVESPESYRAGLRAAAQAAVDRGEFAAAERSLTSLLKTELAPAEHAEADALFAFSLAASGRHRDAIDRYRLSLATLPADERPLWADNACAQLALLLEEEEPGAASAAWAEYLRRFPDGVHASMARARVGSEKER